MKILKQEKEKQMTKEIKEKEEKMPRIKEKMSRKKDVMTIKMKKIKRWSVLSAINQAIPKRIAIFGNPTQGKQVFELS